MSAVRSRQHPPFNPRESKRGAVVQLVRIPACHAGGRGFESRPLGQNPRGSFFFSPRDTMFDFVTKHKRLLQFVLALMIVPPFAFWGIQWTQRETAGAGEVASVGGQKITEQEFSEALRQQQDRVRGMLGRNFDPAMFDSPALRLELLEGMVSQRLMMQHASRNHLTVSDEMLVETTMAIPAFQVDGKFSRDRYDAALRSERMSAEAFDSALRRDLLMQQLTGALADSGLASKAVSRQFAQLRAQQREIAEYRVQADVQLAQSKITGDATRAFY